MRSAYRAIVAPAERERAFKVKSPEYQKSHEDEFKIELARLEKVAYEKTMFIGRKRREAEEVPTTTLSRVVLHMTESPTQLIPPLPTPSRTFPPKNWHEDLRKLYSKIEAVILDNPKLAGDKLLDKLKSELTK